MESRKEIGKVNEEAELEGFPEERVDGENLEIAGGKEEEINTTEDDVEWNGRDAGN